MSVYDVNDTGDLYGGGESQPDEPAAEVQPAADDGTDGRGWDQNLGVIRKAQPSASDAETQSLPLRAGNPSPLLSEVLPPNPADSKLPMGLAVLGACIA